MRRARWIAVGAGMVVIAVAGLAGLDAAPPRPGPEVLAAASRALGREIRAERVGVRLRGGVALELTNVAVAGSPSLASRRAVLVLRLGPLLRRRIELARVVLDAPVVELVEGTGGRLDTGAARAPGGSAATAPELALVAVEVHDGTLRVKSADGRPRVELTHLAATARRPRPDAPLAVDARAQVISPALVLDLVVAHGALDLAGGWPVLDGMLRSSGGHLRMGPRTLALAEATLEGHALGRGGESGRLHARGHLDGDGLALGSVELDGTLTFDAHPRYTGRVRAAPARLGRITAAQLEADVDTGVPSRARFEARDGRFGGSRAGASALGQLEPVLGRATIAGIAARHPDLFGRSGLAFGRVAGTARQAGADMHLDDLVIEGASYTLAGGGRVGARGDLALRLSLTGSRGLTEDVVGQHRVLRAALTDSRGLLAVPLIVRGRVDHPSVSADPAYVAAVRRTIVAGTGLGAIVRRAGAGATGAVERLVGGLLDAVGARRRERR